MKYNSEKIIEIFRKFYEEVMYVVSWEDAAKFLNVPENKFRGEMWNKVSFERLLEKRLNNEIIINQVYMGNNYGQGEWNSFYRVVFWSYLGNELCTINPAKSWFDDNYGELITINLKTQDVLKWNNIKNRYEDYSGVVIRVELDGFGIVQFDHPFGTNTHGVFSNVLSSTLPNNLKEGQRVHGVAEIDIRNVATIKTVVVS